MGIVQVRALCAALSIAAALTAFAATVSSAASRPHPLFGNTVLGNSSEILSMWPELSGQVFVQMRVSNYDSVTAATLIAGTQSAYQGISIPYAQQSDAACGDFDGDGIEDVVWAYTHNMANPDMFYVWLGVSNTRAGDFYMGSGYNYTEQHGGLYSQPNYYRDPGNIRLAVGNFDTTDTREFVLVTRDQAGDGSKRIKLELMKLDSLTRHPVSLATAWGAEQPDGLKESQRFDVAAGDFDNDGVDEIAVGGVSRRADNGNMQVFVTIYAYVGGILVERATSAYGNQAQGSTSNGQGTYFDHVAIATGRLRSDVLTSQVLFSWSSRNASWYEHVLGCSIIDNEWEFYVTTTCHLATLVVDATGGSWTLGGWGVHQKSASLFEQVTNNCDEQYDPAWTGPSLGLAAGDLTGDGLDEVAWAALDRVRVYQVRADTLLWKADVMRAAPGAVGPRAAVQSCSYKDPSRRVVQVADLDPDPDSALVWRPELVVQDWGGASSRLRTRVYRATTDALGGITGLGLLVSADGTATKQQSSVTTVCGDFDGDAVQLGTPKRLFVNNVIRPEIILGAPPIHYAWLGGVEWDISGCYPGFTCSDFAAHYTRETTVGQAISTAVKMDFGLSTELKGSLEAGVPGVGSAKVEGSIKTTFGANFGRTGATETTTEVTTSADAYGGDRVLASEMDYVVWEYPVYEAGRKVMGNIAVVVPDAAGPVRKWYTFDGWLQENQAITHEPGNLLSYPSAVPPNPPDSYLGSLWKYYSSGFQIGPFGTITQAPAGATEISGSFTLTSTDLTTEEQTLGFNAGIELGAKVSSEAGGTFGLVEAKGSMSAEVQGSYHADELITHSTRVGNEINVEATLGWLSPQVADATYTVYPFVYRAKTGVLVLDYAVTLEGVWWTAHYGAVPICLGLHFLFSESEEFGHHAGLNVIKGRVIRFTDVAVSGNGNSLHSRLKIPHMGWNRIRIEQQAPIFKGIPDGAFFYFVHSYYVQPEDESVIAATTEYGLRFTSVLWRDNLFACQFHPEKSQALGLQLLKNFASLT